MSRTSQPSWLAIRAWCVPYRSHERGIASSPKTSHKRRSSSPGVGSGSCAILERCADGSAASHETLRSSHTGGEVARSPWRPRPIPSTRVRMPSKRSRTVNPRASFGPRSRRSPWRIAKCWSSTTARDALPSRSRPPLGSPFPRWNSACLAAARRCAARSSNASSARCLGHARPRDSQPQSWPRFRLAPPSPRRPFSLHQGGPS